MQGLLKGAEPTWTAPVIQMPTPSANSMVPGNIPIYGFIYDVRSGRLIEVPEASNAGRIAA